MASKTIYGGTYNLLAHTLPLTSGITATFVDPEEEGAFEAAVRDNTKAIFVESLGNPNSNVADLEKLAEIAHRHKIPLVVDSTFATPYLLRPIEYGADIVVHSATKFIGGHGTALGGVIVEGGNFDWKDSGNIPGSPTPTQVTTSFFCRRRLRKVPLSPMSGRFSSVIRGQHCHPSMHFFCFRGWRHCLCAWSGMWKMR